MSITLDNGHLTMKGSSKATIKSSIEIVGDFKDIPPHLHQIYMQSMLASYGSVDVYNNTEPMAIKEKKSESRLNKIVELISKAIRK
jgi:hypothetical protein